MRETGKFARMPDKPLPKPTERQQAVLDRLDARMPIKVIAAELGVSETRVNQHVRALKDLYGVESLGELVVRAREHQGYRKTAYSNSHLSAAADRGEQEDRVAPGDFVLADVAPLAIEAPWPVTHEPRVVPGVLDGANAVLFRLAVIVGIAFGIIVLVILAVTAALSVSEALDDVTVISPDSKQVAGG
jgi:DNA-binding CsgD family transcriptional regulator